MNNSGDTHKPAVQRTTKSQGGDEAPSPPPTPLYVKILCGLQRIKNISPERLTGWGTIAIAIVTLAIAVLAYCTLKSSEESTKRSERAYLFAAPNNAYNVSPGSNPLQGYLLIGNSGKTFGRIIDWQFGVNILEPDNSERIESLGRLEREAGNPVIWPGLPHVAFRTLRPVSDAEFQMMQTAKGDKRIYVFGFIKYRDVFGDPHMTTFCHMYFGKEMAPDQPTGIYLETQVKYCEKHNDAD
ncbi:MAG TPA: hypothetical protein VK620_15715 [Bradyrhizobium sp.]|jgi:hypothetical protein|nr:hypothetical protein [Bradyrhizobium sp.]